MYIQNIKQNIFNSIDSNLLNYSLKLKEEYVNIKTNNHNSDILINLLFFIQTEFKKSKKYFTLEDQKIFEKYLF